jgi:adenine/guanine phosphoribosyltransferase-like PRPP-binding protein
MSAGKTARALREHSQQLEAELAAMKARAEKAEADCERFRLYTFKQDAKVAELLSMLA